VGEKAEAPASVAAAAVDENERSLRNLRKRLGQMEELERKRLEGAKLSTEQLEKASKLAQVKDQIAELERNMAAAARRGVPLAAVSGVEDSWDG